MPIHPNYSLSHCSSRDAQRYFTLQRIRPSAETQIHNSVNSKYSTSCVFFCTWKVFCNKFSRCFSRNKRNDCVFLFQTIIMSCGFFFISQILLFLYRTMFFCFFFYLSTTITIFASFLQHSALLNSFGSIAINYFIPK